MEDGDWFAEEPRAQHAFYIAREALNNRSMKRVPIGSWADRPMANSALRRIEGKTASVLLAMGAAALIGWLVVELYVATVTLD